MGNATRGRLYVKLKRKCRLEQEEVQKKVGGPNKLDSGEHGAGTFEIIDAYKVVGTTEVPLINHHISHHVTRSSVRRPAMRSVCPLRSSHPSPSIRSLHRTAQTTADRVPMAIHRRRRSELCFTKDCEDCRPDQSIDVVRDGRSCVIIEGMLNQQY